MKNCSFLVSTVMSMSFLGMGATAPFGWVVHRFGVRWGTFIGLCLAGSSYILIWTATGNAVNYVGRTYLLDIYFLVAGKDGHRQRRQLCRQDVPA